MSWPTVLALELAVPLLLFSAVFGWVANIMGIRDKVGKRMSDLKATMREIFNDRLTRAAGVVFVLIVALVLFNWYSDLSQKYPLFGVFNFSMVPVLFIVGGIIFILAILRSSRDRDDR